MSFSKSWNCTSCFGESNFSFLKNSQVQINFKLNEKNMKNSRGGIPEDLSWSHFFLLRKTFFTVSALNFCCHFVISLAQKISYFLSGNHNIEFWCVTCTGVTHFALVLRLNCTALSQSELSNFFMYIVRNVIRVLVVIYYTNLLIASVHLIIFSMRSA